MSAWDDERHPHLAREVVAIEAALARKTPVLGICLGAQLLARSLGAELRRAERAEIGWHEVQPTLAGRDDSVLGAFRPSEQVFQWHSDTFELPSDAVHLAQGADGACAQQAFRYGENAYGLQFHLEANAALIDRWLATPALCAELEGDDGSGADAIRVQTRERISESLRLSDATFGRFFDRWTGRPRRPRHPHR